MERWVTQMYGVRRRGESGVSYEHDDGHSPHHHVALRRQHPPRGASGNTRHAALRRQHPPTPPRRHQPAVALLVSFVGRILAGGPLDAGHAPLLGLHDLGDALGGLAMEAVHEDAAL